MHFRRCQQTIARVCHVSGRGYWSGTPVTVTFRPAAESTGIVFCRKDLPNVPPIRASAAHRIETSLRTRLASQDATFDMIEHVMSALYAMEVDNCIVECSASELPGLDGSALPYALALEQAGILQQRQLRSFLQIAAPYRIGDDRQWIMVAPTHRPEFICEYRLDYAADSPIPSATYCAQISSKAYVDEIAPARTFVTKAEATNLQEQGLARHVTYRDLLVFDEAGPIDNCLRFDDECARHKTLDLIGDLALSGVRLLGKITAFRSGHVLNGRMAAWLEEQAKQATTTTTTNLRYARAA